MLKVIPKDKQVYGEFNGGGIIENKPIGFPGDLGGLEPFSNLFYWANASSEKGSTIPMHPHKGFEIISYVLEGSIEHFDSKNNSWMPLEAGDLQIIRAGRGISHSEKFNPNSRIFQIWFDPNLAVTNNKEASYNDYKKKDFPLHRSGGQEIIVLKGNKSPLKMDSEGVSIFQYNFEPGSYVLRAKPDTFHSYYIIKGGGTLNELSLKPDLFILANNLTLNFELSEDTQIFEIVNPLKLTYRTYLDMFKKK